MRVLLSPARWDTRLSLVLFGILLGARPASAQTATQPAAAPLETKTYRGLEISLMGAARSSSAGLGDCPPGTNTQRGMARSDEEFVIVTVHVKVLPAFSSGTLDSPAVTGTDGKTYPTAASFVDVGKQPEYSCAFPFRVPQGTQLK